MRSFDGPARHARRLAWLSLVSIAPTVAFVALASLKYGIGVAVPFDAAAPLFLHPIAELIVVTAPWIAAVLAIAPILTLRTWHDERGGRTFAIAVHAVTPNLVAAAASLVLVAFLLFYFLIENV